ncbi:MAG TPA: superoxide dismutase family protein, partial [Candidatus Tectomicrobia bacterium]|nr:superoxide dismutase family protein [Candidatus Tectomicrobia bacterium]
MLAVALVAGCAALIRPPAPGMTASADLNDRAGRSVGAATFTQVGEVVRILLEVRDLPPGTKAVHVHAIGRCDPPDFTTAGGHFNPHGRQHGVLNPEGPHAGDLPNMTVEADGRGRLETASD